MKIGCGHSLIPRLSLFVMSGESEERHMGVTVSDEFTIDQPDPGTRPDSGHSQCTVGLPCN